MSSAIRIDTERLRSHIEYLRNERKLVLELADNLYLARRLADDGLNQRFKKLIQNAEALSDHCSLMSESLEEVCCIFEKLSADISTILDDQIALNFSEYSP